MWCTKALLVIFTGLSFDPCGELRMYIVDCLVVELSSFDGGFPMCAFSKRMRILNEHLVATLLSSSCWLYRLVKLCFTLHRLV